ncbi:hypothetical protein B9Q12_02340 [Candidatus Marsarchaeota G2 archaeon ECH_B_SAG-G06]|uniref:VapB-type antitoxin n=1 Tax=Candidatus Marsarchaeota G2 archaeon ECH_B_SAG-G06 TaxID=1978166 RepID=A0A2R6C0W8_9ARCH|nr:MAG: hypothetical protein B9Q12_02340 [Candidatus Marsarchaeota G2 archaeon ECH_B_SAG-G06]
MKTVIAKVPEPLYYKMKRHKEINWSEVIRQAIEKKLSETEKIKTGTELLEELKAYGINEMELKVTPSQGEKEFQKKLRRKSTIQMS